MRSSEQTMMEFLVQFEMNIPDGVPESEVEDRERAEAAAAETLAGEGHLVRLWQAPSAPAARRSLASIAPAARRTLTDSWALCRSTNGCVRPSRRSFSIRTTR